MKKYNWDNDNYTLNYFFLDCYCQFTLVSCQATFHFLRKDQTSICFGVNLKFQFPLLHWQSNKPKIFSFRFVCICSHCKFSTWVSKGRARKYTNRAHEPAPRDSKTMPRLTCCRSKTKGAYKKHLEWWQYTNMVTVTSLAYCT